MGTPQERADALHRLFRTFFSSQISLEPDARSIFAKRREGEQRKTAEAKATAEQQRKRDEELKRQAIEEFKKEEAKKRRSVPPPHPLGNLAAASRDRAPATPPGPGQEAKPDLSQVSAHDLKRTLKQQNRERFRERLAH